MDEVAAPEDPTAPLTTSADMGIQNDQQVDVILATRNFPIEGDVSVRIAQKWGNARHALLPGGRDRVGWHRVL